jgi:D-amino-acid dehydrogenase
MKVLVLGAGVIGVSSAWYLRQTGHDVTVIERQNAAGLETSFANGGQISVSHAEPWANPGAPLQILRWMFKEDAPLLFRPSLDWRQNRWGLSFLRECTPARTRANIEQLVHLGLYSRDCLRELRASTGLRYDHLEKGILHYFTDAQEFEHALPNAQLMRERGLDLEIKTAAQCVQIEPGLRHIRAQLAGGTYTARDESGDAFKFTQALAELARHAGVQFRYGVKVQALASAGDGIDAVLVSSSHGAQETMRAEAYLMCLGSYSPLLLDPLGVRIAVYPLKGYSITIPVGPEHEAPFVSLTDHHHKIAMSRLGDRFRVAGTAELNGYDLSINRVRCEALVRRAFEVFPNAGDRSRIEFWAGLRPGTPGNVPYLGRTRYRNLYLNTGHGTLGWTNACGSAKAVAELLSGRRPELGFRFYGEGRP